MCNQKIDIYSLFISVTNLGGSENCDKMNLWKNTFTCSNFRLSNEKLCILKKYEEFGLIFMEKSLLCLKPTESKLKYILPYIIF